MYASRENYASVEQRDSFSILHHRWRARHSGGRGSHVAWRYSHRHAFQSRVTQHKFERSAAEAEKLPQSSLSSGVGHVGQQEPTSKWNRGVRIHLDALSIVSCRGACLVRFILRVYARRSCSHDRNLAGMHGIALESPKALGVRTQEM